MRKYRNAEIEYPQKKKKNHPGPSGYVTNFGMYHHPPNTIIY
jgi:hypothetical protein